jgi:hypothetical protein
MRSESLRSCALLSPELAPPWSIRFCDLHAALDREDPALVESWLLFDIDIWDSFFSFFVLFVLLSASAVESAML